MQRKFGKIQMGVSLAEEDSDNKQKFKVKHFVKEQHNNKYLNTVDIAI